MKIATMTDRVWSALLALRDGVAPLAPRGWTEDETAAWALYAPIARRSPSGHRVAQIGQSLDGRVATIAGDARDISGPDGLAHLHRCRALVDAVVIGVRTALHDSPQLTVRLVPGPNPARVVIDPQGRLPDDAPLLRDDGARRIIVQAVDRPRAPGIEVIRLGAPRAAARADGAGQAPGTHRKATADPGSAAPGWIAPAEIVAALHAAGLRHLLIEGGGITISGFLEAGLLDRLHVGIAPLIIGAGPMSLTTPNPVEKLSQALRPTTHTFALGSDLMVDCDLLPAVGAETWAGTVSGGGSGAGPAAAAAASAPLQDRPGGPPAPAATSADPENPVGPEMFPAAARRA
jgi:riboflavin biosynthesis pyrimidine reductase